MKQKGMPIGAPLAHPGPYSFQNSEFHIFILEMDGQEIYKWIPEKVKLKEPVTVLLVASKHPQVVAEGWPDMEYDFLDLSILTPVTVHSNDSPLLFPIFSYCNLDVTIATGREVYGIPYKFGNVTVDYKEVDKTLVCDLTRRGTGLVTLKAKLDRKIIEQDTEFAYNLKNYLGLELNEIALKNTTRVPLESTNKDANRHSDASGRGSYQPLAEIALKLLNYKEIPDVIGKGAQLTELTLVTPLIKLKQVHLYNNENIELEFFDSEVDPFKKLGNVDRIIGGIKVNCDLKLSTGTVIK